MALRMVIRCVTVSCASGRRDGVEHHQHDEHAGEIGNHGQRDVGIGQPQGYLVLGVQRHRHRHRGEGQQHGARRDDGASQVFAFDASQISVMSLLVIAGSSRCIGAASRRLRPGSDGLFAICYR